MTMDIVISVSESPLHGETYDPALRGIECNQPVSGEERANLSAVVYLY